MNKPGKIFENLVKQSAIEQGVDYTRLKDAGYRGDNSDQRRFTPKNICDCILFRSPVILFAEIKRRNASLAFKEITQLDDLGTKWEPSANKYSGVICELKGCCFFIGYHALILMRESLGKKSFNAVDAHHYGQSLRVFIPQGKRTPRIDIEMLLRDIQLERVVA